MFVRAVPPRILSKADQARLLEVVAQGGNARGLTLLMLALGTGLRLREVVGLNVGHVAPNGTEVAWRIELPREITKGGRGGVAFLPRKVRTQLRRFLAWKRAHGESLGPEAPLLASRQRRRISLRQVQVNFARWQEVAGFERHYNFHTLRHTAITNVYRATKDLFLAQRFARHMSPMTTVIYTHPSDEEIYRALQRVRA
jgi:site-specific recombinase XerC